jgi:hypothetical protein
VWNFVPFLDRFFYPSITFTCLVPGANYSGRFFASGATVIDYFDHLYEGHGTGAIFRPPDSRDFLLEQDAEVKEFLMAPGQIPFNYDGRSKIKEIPNQGGTPACVAFSTATGMSSENLDDFGGEWIRFDQMRIYTEAGGSGSAGVPTSTVLGNGVSKGYPVQGTTQRLKIAAYAFAPKEPAAWIETCKAALLANKFVVIATLLPTQFGWNSNTTLAGVGSYHQLLHVGWDEEGYFIFANSWGREWGLAGFGRIHTSVLTGGSFQGGYCYAYSAVDIDEAIVPKPPPIPDPPPPSDLVVTGRVTGSNTNALAVGQSHPLGPGNTMVITQIAAVPKPNPDPDPNPDPNPDPIPIPGVWSLNMSPTSRRGSRINVYCVCNGPPIASGTIMMLTCLTPTGSHGTRGAQVNSQVPATWVVLSPATVTVTVQLFDSNRNLLAETSKTL